MRCSCSTSSEMLGAPALSAKPVSTLRGGLMIAFGVRGMGRRIARQARFFMAFNRDGVEPRRRYGSSQDPQRAPKPSHVCCRTSSVHATVPRLESGETVEKDSDVVRQVAADLRAGVTPPDITRRNVLRALFLGLGA